MHKTVKYLLLLSIWLLVCPCFAQHYFRKNNDSCYCNDIFIMGIVNFDTLTQVINPHPPKVKYKGFIKEDNRQSFFIDKSKSELLLKYNYKNFKNAIFEDDVYTMIYPIQFGTDFILPCSPDSIKSEIMDIWLHYGYTSLEWIPIKYRKGQFYFYDYTHTRYVAVLLNVKMYNMFLIDYRVWPRQHIFWNNRLEQGLFIKVLFPIRDKETDNNQSTPQKNSE